jgi:hypothetical protein
LFNVDAMVIGSTSYDDTAFMSPYAPHNDTEAAYTAATRALWSSQPTGPGKEALQVQQLTQIYRITELVFGDILSVPVPLLRGDPAERINHKGWKDDRQLVICQQKVRTV